MSTLCECVYCLATVFIDEFGDEKDVVGAGKHREDENYGVNGGQVVAGTVRNAGGEDDGGYGDNLNGRVDFTEHRRPETAETGDDVDGGSADKDEHVPANHGHGH